MMNVIVINIQYYDYRIMVEILDSSCIYLSEGYDFIKGPLLVSSSGFFLRSLGDSVDIVFSGSISGFLYFGWWLWQARDRSVTSFPSISKEYVQLAATDELLDLVLKLHAFFHIMAMILMVKAILVLVPSFRLASFQPQAAIPESASKHEHMGRLKGCIGQTFMMVACPIDQDFKLSNLGWCPLVPWRRLTPRPFSQTFFFGQNPQAEGCFLDVKAGGKVKDGVRSQGGQNGWGNVGTVCFFRMCIIFRPGKHLRKIHQCFFHREKKQHCWRPHFKMVMAT